MAVIKNHILVPIDFSEQALIALSQSFNLARLTKTEITLLYVMEDDSINPLAKILGRSSKDSALNKLRQKLEKLADETTSESGVKISTLVVKGKIYEQIVKVAKRIKATFIIMGTNGSQGLKTKFIGSNALNVVRDSPCPVITIKGKKHRQGCKHIVLPLDLTKETREKVTKSIELAKLFGSAVHAVSVMTDNDEFHVNKLKRQISQVKNYIEEHGVECVADLIKGESITETVINYARKVNGDLIMIMTQQENDFIEFFVGSKAQQVIHGSDIPVLSIRPIERKNTSSFVPY
jgi:nucleotide-binding universal stress UspA family protein